MDVQFTETEACMSEFQVLFQWMLQYHNSVLWEPVDFITHNQLFIVVWSISQEVGNTDKECIKRTDHSLHVDIYSFKVVAVNSEISVLFLS